MEGERLKNSPLRALRPEADLSAFFAALGRSPRRLLMLDYDGTLAPFVEERHRAVPYPGVRALLSKLIAEGRTRIVIISGRAVDDLRPLLGMDPLPEIWGSHGWERLHADGRYQPPQLPEGLRSLLLKEWSWLQSAFDEERLERKPASVAVHWRGVPGEDRRWIRERALMRWSSFRDMSQLDLHAFDGGLELRAAGRTKGDAVLDLLRETPLDTPAVYCGDDRTDEDAFAALEGRGLRILVRRTARPTRADVHCVPPEGLLTFLQQWVTTPV